MKYRRKPEAIEAIQLRRDTWDEVCELVSLAAWGWEIEKFYEPVEE